MSTNPAPKRTRKELEKELAELRAAQKPRTPEEEHQHRMATDRAYAEHFIRNSMPAGRTFTVNLLCVDPIASQELFKLCQEHTKAEAEPRDAEIPRRAVPLLAGCEVTAIFTGDMVTEHITMKTNILRAMGMVKEEGK